MPPFFLHCGGNTCICRIHTFSAFTFLPVILLASG
jgi:hypothetical protein